MAWTWARSSRASRDGWRTATVASNWPPDSWWPMSSGCASASPRMAPRALGELLLIGRRHVRDNNSWMHNVPRLVSGKSRYTLMMHPEDALRLGLSEGQDALVRSRVGEVSAPVSVTDDVMPGVVSLPHGYGHGREGVRLQVAGAHAGASINDITDDRALDELSGNAAFSGIPVRVQPLQSPASKAPTESHG